MKLYNSAYDLPCYNYAKIVAGDVRYLIDDDARNYPSKLNEDEINSIEQAFKDISIELPNGLGDKKINLIDDIKTDIFEAEEKYYLFQKIELIFNLLEMQTDKDYINKVITEIYNFGVSDKKIATKLKIRFKNVINEKKGELKDILKKNQELESKYQFNEGNFFDTILSISNATGVYLDPKKTSIASFIRRYNLLKEDERRLKEKRQKQ